MLSALLTAALDGIPASPALNTAATPRRIGEIPDPAYVGSRSPLASSRPATYTLGYSQAISSQIQALITQGPGTLQTGAGRDLRISSADLQNTLAAAPQHNGEKPWRTVDSKISAIEQMVSSDAAAGRIPVSAATPLTGELQHLADRLPTDNG